MDIVEKLTRIADASIRADGTDIPLGEQCREAAAEITALRKRVAELERDCGPLVEACHEDMMSNLCDFEPDDEPVGKTMDEDGNITSSKITFGMIRRARATLGGTDGR